MSHNTRLCIFILLSLVVIWVGTSLQSDRPEPETTGQLAEETTTTDEPASEPAEYSPHVPVEPELPTANEVDQPEPEAEQPEAEVDDRQSLASYIGGFVAVFLGLSILAGGIVILAHCVYRWYEDRWYESYRRRQQVMSLLNPDPFRSYTDQLTREREASRKTPEDLRRERAESEYRWEQEDKEEAERWQNWLVGVPICLLCATWFLYPPYEPNPGEPLWWPTWAIITFFVVWALLGVVFYLALGGGNHFAGKARSAWILGRYSQCVTFCLFVLVLDVIEIGPLIAFQLLPEIVQWCVYAVGWIFGGSGRQ